MCTFLVFIFCSNRCGRQNSNSIGCQTVIFLIDSHTFVFLQKCNDTTSNINTIRKKPSNLSIQTVCEKILLRFFSFSLFIKLSALNANEKFPGMIWFLYFKKPQTLNLVLYYQSLSLLFRILFLFFFILNKVGNLMMQKENSNELLNFLTE